jgi:hypothetical protein
VVKRKIPSLHRESKPRTPIVQPLAQRYTDWAVTAPAGSFREIVKLFNQLVFMHLEFCAQRYT